MNVPKATTSGKRRSLWGVRGCLITFAVGLLMIVLLSSVGMATLLRGLV